MKEINLILVKTYYNSWKRMMQLCADVVTEIHTDDIHEAEQIFEEYDLTMAPDELLTCFDMETKIKVEFDRELFFDDSEIYDEEIGSIIDEHTYIFPEDAKRYYDEKVDKEFYEYQYGEYDEDFVEEIAMGDTDIRYIRFER